MRIYKTQEEMLKDVKDDVLVVDDSVTFEFSFSMGISLKIAGNISAKDINAWNISAKDINAWDINARDINAWNINARDINAKDINAGDISAGDINARDINARDILYYAFCCVYQSIKCFSIKAKREKYSPPIYLEGKLVIKKKGAE